MKHQANTTEQALAPSGAVPQPACSIDTETLALLEKWAREDATDDPEQLQAARKELDEFKRSMNE